MDDKMEVFGSGGKSKSYRNLSKMFLDHVEMSNRFNKTLYYGKSAKTDRPSLPMTDVAVELFANAVPDSLGAIDMDFAAALSKKAQVSPCSMILALVYLRRLKQRDPEYLQHVSSSHLFIVSMMVASKFLYDEGEDEEVYNDEWAAWSGVDVKEINQLERQFLDAVDWEVYVDPVKFQLMLQRVENHVAWSEGATRGWLSYTEAVTLRDSIRLTACWNLLLDSIIKVILVSSVAYTVCVLTIVGSVIAANHVTRTERFQSKETQETSVHEVQYSSWENVTSWDANVKSCYSCLCVLPNAERFPVDHLEFPAVVPTRSQCLDSNNDSGSEANDTFGLGLDRLWGIRKTVNVRVASVPR